MTVTRAPGSYSRTGSERRNNEEYPGDCGGRAPDAHVLLQGPAGRGEAEGARDEQGAVRKEEEGGLRSRGRAKVEGAGGKMNAEKVAFRELVDAVLRYRDAIRKAAKPNADNPELIRKTALIGIRNEFIRFGMAGLIDWN